MCRDRTRTSRRAFAGLVEGQCVGRSEYYLQYDTVGGGGNCFVFFGKQFIVLRARGGVQAPWACLGLYSLGGLG